MSHNLVSIEEAIAELKAGRMIILVDDENRENEGDLVLAGEFTTPEAINFMATHGRGLICLTMTRERVEFLGLPLMVVDNNAKFKTASTVSIEAATGVTTGISAPDRARTIQAAINPDAKPSDVVQPGHIFPLMARDGGVLVRAGHTEGSVDLARLAGLNPSGVICEILKEDGTMARLPDLVGFAKIHNLKIASIADLIEYRRRNEQLVHRTVESRMPSRYGNTDFTMVLYSNDVDEKEHIALTLGEVGNGDPVLVRVHSECLTGDIFGSKRCDCGEQLHVAMEQIAKEGRGVLLYLRQEGRGIGLTNKLHAYNLQDKVADTVEANQALGLGADLREYGIGAQILKDLGVRKMRLMTNNPKKIVGIEGYGLEMVERVPLQICPNEENRSYLKTKKEKLGHLLEGCEEEHPSNAQD